VGNLSEIVSLLVSSV